MRYLIIPLFLILSAWASISSTRATAAPSTALAATNTPAVAVADTATVSPPSTPTEGAAAVTASPDDQGNGVTTVTYWPMFRLNQHHTGAQVWSFQTVGEVFSSPAIADDGVYVGSNDSFLYAFSARSGEHLWHTSLGGASFSSPAVLKELVYIGSSDGNLYGVDRSTGQVTWSFLVGDKVRVWTSPAVVDGAIYFGAHDGHIYAIDGSQE